MIIMALNKRAMRKARNAIDPHTVERFTCSARFGDDNKASRMLAVLAGKPRGPRKKKTVTLRRFSWE